MDGFTIRAKGLKELQRKFTLMPRTVQSELLKLRRQLAAFVLADQGGGKLFYPPETAANRPPEPYYERGVGTHYSNSVVNTSEQLDNKFTVDQQVNSRGISFSATNEASYSPYVIGDEQSRFMAALGWQTLVGFVNKNISKIVKLYERGIEAALKRLRLK